MSAIAGLIFAGGSSRRFGGRKADAMLDGRRLIDHVAARIQPQVTVMAVAGPTPVDGAISLDDGEHRGKGPLAGLYAGLSWASTQAEIEWLATCPCDIPLVPTNLVSLLTQNATSRPRVLNIERHWQTGCALWPLTAISAIGERLNEAADLSLHSALRSLNADASDTDPASLEGSFFNINTHDDLTRLSKEFGQSHG